MLTYPTHTSTLAGLQTPRIAAAPGRPAWAERT